MALVQVWNVLHLYLETCPQPKYEMQEGARILCFASSLVCFKSHILNNDKVPYPKPVSCM